jgi:AcrR family transcriptional regulator
MSDWLTPAGPSSAGGGGKHRLPSGRHGLSRKDVESSQRRRIIHAIFDAVAEKGYPATTIRDVVERAEVSRRTFYEHFADKEACFLAAFDSAVAQMGTELKDILDALPKDDWRERVRQSWRVFLRALAAHPPVTWSLYVETFAAGPALVQRTAAVNEGYAEIFRRLHQRARQQDPTLRELPPAVFSLYIGGTAERIRDCLHTRGAAALPELEDLFVDTALIVFAATSAPAPAAPEPSTPKPS